MLKKIALLCLACMISVGWADPGPTVVTSILPLYHIAQAVVGTQGNVVLLVPQGASEHAYSLTPSQYEAMNQADVVVWVGPILETYLVDALARVPEKKKMTLMNDRSLIRYDLRSEDQPDEGVLDPHVWLDPLNAVTIATQLTKRLKAIDPAHQKIYARQLDMFAKRISALNTTLDKQLAPFRTVPFVTYHDAYQYFEKRYGLRRIESISANEHVPLSATRWIEMSLLLKSENIHCILSEPQHQTDLLKQLAAENHANVGLVDPLGTKVPAGVEGYVALLTTLSNSIAACLAPVIAQGS